MSNSTSITKKARVQQMLEKQPTSVADIAKALDVSKPAAYSLIGDLKRAGVKITGALKDGAMAYSVAKEPSKKKPKKSFSDAASSQPSAS